MINEHTPILNCAGLDSSRLNVLFGLFIYCCIGTEGLPSAPLPQESILRSLHLHQHVQIEVQEEGHLLYPPFMLCVVTQNAHAHTQTTEETKSTVVDLATPGGEHTDCKS